MVFMEDKHWKPVGAHVGHFTHLQPETRTLTLQGPKVSMTTGGDPKGVNEFKICSVFVLHN